MHRYAEDPTTEVLCMSWQVGNDDIRQWRKGEAFPQDLIEHVADGGPMVHHNAAFERGMWNETLTRQVDETLPSLKIEQQHCTQARGRVMGLPASLDNMGSAVRANVQKDKEGYRLMMQMCKPRSLDEHGNITWWEDEDRLTRLQAYCDQDVATEHAIDQLVPQLSERERRVWELDQRINDRGLKLDEPMIRKAMAVVTEATKRADREMWRLTNGAVKKCTEVAKIVDWINSQGVHCESIAEGEHEGLIVTADFFDRPDVENVIRLRAASAKAFKFPAMLACLCKDGRVYDSLGFHGTVQGRWIGRVVQFHNMKRVDTEEEAEWVRMTVAMLSGPASVTEIVDWMEFMFPAPLEVLSLCTRAAIIAEDDHRLMGGDFSNIEGRLNAWFAGEQWKLQAFRDFDDGIGPDLYKVTAGNIIGIPTEAVSKAQRQEQGKVPELACGYQGALGAFKKMGAKYGVRLSDERIRQIVGAWRDTNPRIVASWRELQDAAIEAMGAPGCIVSACGGKVQYTCDPSKNFLYCKLPSGRVISYCSPSLKWKSKTIKIDGDDVEFNRWTVSYWGEHKGWRELDLYGGMQCAHVVSGTARDVLVAAMFRLEHEGYPTVLTIHDEALSEVRNGFGSVEHYLHTLKQKPRWLAEVPIAATAWEDVRYSK